MPGYGVLPSIRVRDLSAALEFYTQRLGFEIVRGGPGDDNVSIRRGDASLMLETVADFYSPGYNAAIRNRLEGNSATTLYIEAEDLDALHEAAVAAGVTIPDPLARREWGQHEFTVEDPEGNWLTFWKGLA